MGDAVSKDGALTKVVEALPGGGLITAPFHELAGNSDHAAKAVASGVGTAAAAALGGPIGAAAIGANAAATFSKK
uniref:Uncharacterized protein n=2 Tax=Caenorhabditis japonica TaxID=281687 RepID=A0A8R1IMA8_CAEJA